MFALLIPVGLVPHNCHFPFVAYREKGTSYLEEDAPPHRLVLNFLQTK